MNFRIGLVISALPILSLVSGCAGMRSFFGVQDGDRVRPIANPFYSYKTGPKGDPNQTMVLRTKKGDRSVEIEIPADSQKLSDFVLPLSPAFKEQGRSLASADEAGAGPVDETYRKRPPSISDIEITKSFSQGSPDIEAKRDEIEKGLNLMPYEDDSPFEGTPNYLANLDHIKQLYKSARFEAALIETDDLIKEFQTDPKLYEMKGTLLERLGKRELALKSWNQALRINPKNESLRKFIERKQVRTTAGTP